MKVWKLRHYLYKSARFLGDVQAVKTGHVAKRIERRFFGRVFGKLLRGLFK